MVERVKAQQTLRLETERPNPHKELKPRALCRGGYRGKGWVPCGVRGLCPQFHPCCRNPWVIPSSFPYCRKSCSGEAFRTWPPRLLRFTRGWRRKPTKTRYWSSHPSATAARQLEWVRGGGFWEILGNQGSLLLPSTGHQRGCSDRLPAGLEGGEAVLGSDGVHGLLRSRPQGPAQPLQRLHRGKQAPGRAFRGAPP